MDESEPDDPIQHRRREHSQTEKVVSEPGRARGESRKREGMECGEVSEGERAERVGYRVEREGVEDRKREVREVGEERDEWEGVEGQAVVGLREVDAARLEVSIDSNSERRSDARRQRV